MVVVQDSGGAWHGGGGSGSGGCGGGGVCDIAVH